MSIAERALDTTGARGELHRTVAAVPPPDRALWSRLRRQVALEWLEQALRARGHEFERTHETSVGAAHVRLQLVQGAGASRDLRAEQGYRLRIAEASIDIAASCHTGIQHGLATLVQCVSQASGALGHLVLPELEVEDYPDFRVRGVMLDVSRDKVPTLPTLRMLSTGSRAGR